MSTNHCILVDMLDIFLGEESSYFLGNPRKFLEISLYKTMQFAVFERKTDQGHVIDDVCIYNEGPEFKIRPDRAQYRR